MSRVRWAFLSNLFDRNEDALFLFTWPGMDSTNENGYVRPKYDFSPPMPNAASSRPLYIRWCTYYGDVVLPYVVKVLGLPWAGRLHFEFFCQSVAGLPSTLLRTRADFHHILTYSNTPSVIHRWKEEDLRISTVQEPRARSKKVKSFFFY